MLKWNSQVFQKIIAFHNSNCLLDINWKQYDAIDCCHFLSINATVSNTISEHDYVVDTEGANLNRVQKQLLRWLRWSL